MNDDLERRLSAQLPGVADLRRDRAPQEPPAPGRPPSRTALLACSAVLGCAALVAVGVLVLRTDSEKPREIVVAQAREGPPLVGSMQVYSGRPNPTWELGAEEQGRLLSILEALPVAPERAEDSPMALGFTGFELSSADGALGIEVSVRVDSPQVIVREGGAERALMDPDGSVMELLATSAAAHLDDPSLQEDLEPFVS